MTYIFQNSKTHQLTYSSHCDDSEPEALWDADKVVLWVVEESLGVVDQRCEENCAQCDHDEQQEQLFG